MLSSKKDLYGHSFFLYLSAQRSKRRESPNTVVRMGDCRAPAVQPRTAQPVIDTPPAQILRFYPVIQVRFNGDQPIFTTASSYGSNDALHILDKVCTPASVLFDSSFTSRQRSSPALPFRTFPPSPTAIRLPHSLPSTISVQNLDPEENTADMDKRHPSSFQQLEKLGEGTYATVCAGNAFGIVETRRNGPI
jgi:hypothetical protein